MAHVTPITAGAWLAAGMVSKAATSSIRKVAEDQTIPFMVLSNSEEGKRSSAKAVVSAHHLKSLTNEEELNCPGKILPAELVQQVTTAASDAVFACTGTRRIFADVEIYVSLPGAQQQKMHLDGLNKNYIAVFINCYFFLFILQSV